jgi:CO dehydrogenase maturation factor
MKTGRVPDGMTKDVFMSMKLEQAVIEDKGYDLVVMGKPEGPGCYCAANTLLTRFLDRLTKNYPYVVMDNEAGMEHISRLTTSNIDILLIISDTSRRGLQAAIRIDELSKALNIGVGKSFLVLNQTKNAPAKVVLDMLEAAELELAGLIPEDPDVYEYDLVGRPTIELPESNNAVQAAFEIFERILKGT